ncbi:FKBP-type peptidyl-prolyl cis-trans isomerase N-terminal domain-containing protein [Rahnella bruchi]|uniref:FKBP-type peptidyl-prolyl cis-trans isomerase N-terminal domain-containing protein n=1 Tax=Rahnella bruchi TaxID=1510573 RepID=UPI000EA2857D|nr:FKBP-type peptidyl-prolyl cis-trans isomerase N-terminal domain-containing protein [Rahnella bruchi]
MPISRKNGIYLFGALMMSGMTLSASAAEPAAAPVIPSATAPVAASAAPVPAPAPAMTAEKTPEAVPAETPVKAPVAAPAPEQTPVAPAKQEPAKNVIPEDVTDESIKAAGIAPAPAQMLDSEEQKRAYASGVMLAHFIEEQLANQKSLHITLNKNILLAGIADTFAHQVKMSDEDIRVTMSTFDEQVKVLTQAQNEKKQAQEKAYVDAFAKREGVKKTKQGLLYFIDNKGDGPALKDTDMVQVNYKGTLVDGTVVDAPKIDNANEIFRVANMPPVLRDSVKLIRKGGQITVVIPPATLEKAKDAKGESPLNTVVIYTISVVDVNQPQ